MKIEINLKGTDEEIKSFLASNEKSGATFDATICIVGENKMEEKEQALKIKAITDYKNNLIEVIEKNFESELEKFNENQQDELDSKIEEPEDFKCFWNWKVLNVENGNVVDKYNSEDEVKFWKWWNSDNHPEDEGKQS